VKALELKQQSLVQLESEGKFLEAELLQANLREAQKNRE
jgi:hypothetical protein